MLPCISLHSFIHLAAWWNFSKSALAVLSLHQAQLSSAKNKVIFGALRPWVAPGSAIWQRNADQAIFMSLIIKLQHFDLLDICYTYLPQHYSRISILLLRHKIFISAGLVFIHKVPPPHLILSRAWLHCNVLLCCAQCPVQSEWIVLIWRWEEIVRCIQLCSAD